MLLFGNSMYIYQSKKLYIVFYDYILQQYKFLGDNKKKNFFFETKKNIGIWNIDCCRGKSMGDHSFMYAHTQWHCVDCKLSLIFIPLLIITLWNLAKITKKNCYYLSIVSILSAQKKWYKLIFVQGIYYLIIIYIKPFTDFMSINLCYPNTFFPVLFTLSIISISLLLLFMYDCFYLFCLNTSCISNLIDRANNDCNVAC